MWFNYIFFMKPILLVLAAGMGSRYGGLKQMDRLGPGGESIIDYSVYDALKAGFGKIIFVLKEEIVDDFYTLFANRYKHAIQVDHVIQNLSEIPQGINPHPDRVKPWGTGHAVLSAAHKLDRPFGVINGDDFYGSDAFRVMAEFLLQTASDDLKQQAMVGYILKNTLSDHGFVSRGICEVDELNKLSSVVERTHIERKNGQIFYKDGKGLENRLNGDESVSMNFWGFTPAILESFHGLFLEFMETKGGELKSEFFIPYGINLLIESNKISVEVLKSTASWFGVTYQEDKPVVVSRLDDLVRQGIYPKSIW